MKTISFLCFLLLLFGCAEFNSIHKKSDLNNNVSTVAIDAKQRFLVSTTITDRNEKGEVIGSWTGVCAEPSPDAFAVYSAALEGNASYANEMAVALKAVIGENAGTIGVRTEAITLMRDAMYRLCEAYMSGGIERKVYAKMVSKYQKSMVTLIAIEQLTGAAQPAQLVLNSSATLALNDSILKAKENLDNARRIRDEVAEKLSSITKEVNEKKAALSNDIDKNCPNGIAADEKNKQKCSDYFAATKKRDEVKSDLNAREKDVLEWSQVFEKATASINMATQAASEAIKANATKVNNDSMAAISNTVKSMVEDVFLDDAITTCITQVAEFAGIYYKNADVKAEFSSSDLPISQFQIDEFKNDKKALYNLCNNLLAARYSNR